jgi:hypothetical protein
MLAFVGLVVSLALIGVGWLWLVVRATTDQ